MLSHEQNELITHTGGGTPMGELMRRYWVPAFLSAELPGPDCPPVQVRILGEELVAFRDSDGRIGLLAEHCSHRGTSLFYGRNEACGLTCIYHGWRYDVEGHVLDTPAEPAGSTFKERLRHPAYPTHEAGGIVFAFMGPRELQPLFPRYDWVDQPADHCYVTKCLQECNYLQGLEGECDSSHLSFLHQAFGVSSLSQMDGAPEYQTEETDFGTRLIAMRNAGADRTYVRLSSFVLPVGCAVPVGGRGEAQLDGYEVHFYTPYDDTHSWRFDFGFRRSRSVKWPDDVHRSLIIDQNHQRIINAGNKYQQDREMQRNGNFTGMKDFLTHDSCATESMGALFDRSQEHLGISDKGVIAVRQKLLDAVRTMEQGHRPPHIVTDPADNDFRHAESNAGVIEGRDWHAAFPLMVRSTQELASLGRPITDRHVAGQRVGAR